jgi:TP901 family phage tail tape measure protein
MAYNLPMQISLQAPLQKDITPVKAAIEKGLKGINVGSAIKSSVTKPIKLPIEVYVTNKTIKSMKDSIQAKFATGISADLKMSSKSISDQKKKVQTAFANLKVGIAVTKKDITDSKKIMAKKFANIPITVKVTKKNITDIRKSIEAGLQNLTISINPNINQGNINQQTKKVSKSLKSATGNADSFFDSLEGKARSFTAYAIVSTAIYKLAAAVSNATNEAIKYERELINIAQTTGDSIERTKLFSDVLVDISKKYNINVSQVAKLTRILAQTGMSFREATQGAEILARTSLLSGFDDLTSTTEGLVAIMQTFNMTVNSAGQVLESINAVSKKYAIESTDLVESIKRTGGAFSVAGGTVEELIALITSVRSTTRESAETIATGFRTIFGRLQRPKTIEYFKKLGIELEDAEGKFVGPFEAINRINEGLARLNITVGDVRFAEVVEQIGGIRQISKVVPLLTQAKKSQEALKLANEGGTESIKDLEKAQQGLGYRLGTLQKEFAALISEIINSNSFKFLADVFINLSRAVIKTVSAFASFKPLLPILSTLATFKIGRTAGQVLAGNTTLAKSFGFASGGYVPGSGNSDTVPAMLTPGEFVINKKSSQAFGYGNLSKINKYADGGIVTDKKTPPGAYVFHASRSGKDDAIAESFLKEGARSDLAHGYGQGKGFYVYTSMQKAEDHAMGLLDPTAMTGAANEGSPFIASFYEKLHPKNWNLDYEYNSKLVTKWITDNYNQLKKYLEGQKIEHPEFPSQLPPITVTGLVGQGQENKGISLESTLSSGTVMKDEVLSNNRGDIKSGRYLGQIMSHLRKNEPNIVYNLEGWAFEHIAEKKWDSDIKGIKYVGKEPLKPFSINLLDETGKQTRFKPDEVQKNWSSPKKFASGGAVGTDTVPAMLTPGEYVVNKKSAQAFGYGNLEKVNKYAKGGIVNGVQHFAEGGKAKRTWSEFFGFKKKTKDPIQEDIKQEGGELINTFDDLKNAVESVTADMGDLGEQILKQVKLAVEASVHDGKLYKGGFRPDIAKIQATPGRADRFTVAHEVGHVSDYLMGGSKLGTEEFPLPGKVGAERFASGQKGTLQNKLAKIAQKKMYTELKAQGVSEEDLRYRLTLREIYADLVAKSGPAVRAILTSTTSARKGIQELAHLLENEPEVYDRLFMGIEAEIPALVKARKRGLQAIQDAAIGAEIEKEKQLEAAKQAELAAEAEKQNRIEAEKKAAIAAQIEKDRQRTLQIERSNNVKALRSEGPITAKKAKKGLQTEESKAIGLEIRKENEKIKGLSKAKEEAQARSEQLPKNLASLKAGVQMGVISQANYNKTAKQINAQIKKEEELINTLEEQIQESKNNTAQLQNQYKASQQKSQSLLYSAANVPPSFPKGGGGGSGGGVPPIGPVAHFSKAVTAAGDKLNKLNLTFIELATYAQGTASIFSQFMGIDINQGALTAGTVKGGVLSTVGDTIGSIGSRVSEDDIKQAGVSLRSFSKQLPDSIGKPLKKAGNLILGNSATISKNILKVAKVFDILSKVELAGGLIDALFSKDYAKERDNLIQLGDAAGAAEAATKAYAQEQVRAIPLIGGFLSALGANSSATEDSLDANGKLAVANARLAATINGSDKAFKKSTETLRQARLGGDKEAEKTAISEQLDVIDNLNKMSADVAAKQGAAGVSGTSVFEGAVGGAATGAFVGSFFGPVGTAIGAAAGALAGGTAAWFQSASAAKEQIAKGYSLMTDAIKKGAELQTAMIKDFSQSLASESQKILLAGGTAEEAFAKTTEKLGGEEQVKRILGGTELTGNYKEDIGELGMMSNMREDRIKQLETYKAGLSDSDKAGINKAEQDIEAEKAQKSRVDELRNELVQINYQNEQTKKLIERRKIEAAAIEYQVRIMKQLETSYDNFNASARELANISEEMANIGTGKLSTRQAASRVGVDDMRMLEMDAKEIMRTPDVAEQMAAYASSAGAPGQEINKASLRVRQLSQLSQFAKDGKLSDLSQSTTEDAGTDAKKELQQKIFNELGFDENDPILREAVAKMADTIITDGITATGKAEQEARDIITKQAEDIIAKQQEKIKEVIQAEQQLRENQIALINKQMENTKKVYENEKAYFDERLALNQKVRDALQIEPSGPKKASFLGQNALATRNSQMAALSARTGGANISQSISANVNRLNVLRSTNNEKGINNVEIAKINASLELLSQAVRDQIDIENQYLDGLIGMAKAQQEYTQALYDAQGSIVRDLVTGTDEEIGQQLSTLNAAAIASMQGSFTGIPETLKKDIFSLFDQFGDVTIPGLGKTGREAQKEISKNEMMKRFGVDAATAEQLASKAVNDRVPIDQRMADQIEDQRKIVEKLMWDEYYLKESQILREIDNTKQFELKVMQFGTIVNKMISDLGMSRTPIAGGPVNAPMAQIPNQQQDSNNKPIQIETNGQQAMTVNLTGLHAMTNNVITGMIYEQVAQSFKNLAQEVKTANNFEDVSRALENAATQTQTVEMGNV